MQDDAKRTFAVAGTLCLVCSVLVSTAAVVLRPAQQENQRLDVQKNILEVAGIYDETKPIGAQYDDGWKKLVVLGHMPGSKPGELGKPNGEQLSKEDAADVGIDFATFDSRKAIKNEKLSKEIDDGALPQIARRSHYMFVYEIRGDSKDAPLEKIILPIYGKGLWSTLYGFISLEPDCETIAGITFYDHGETPGLGGEVDNADWKASWQGKKAFNNGDFTKPTISVVKGKGTGHSQIDGLSGATITSKGVNDLVKYWLGPDAFGPYLDRVRSEQNPKAE
jgi:Na+-transporting NADH:ubiquinone oxidoreductase subunit C